MRGVLLFAFNNGVTDYFKMAISNAKRARHFLKLPVTVVTDKNTTLSNYDISVFDQIRFCDSDDTNKNVRGEKWLNKGRYRAYELSPYYETLLLDTDYLVNSDRLLTLFDLYEDFMCHKTTRFLMSEETKAEEISMYSFDTLWATVIAFKKTEKVKQIFDCLQMIQHNYEHYAKIYNFSHGMYRNDYGITLALHIVNGNTVDKRNIIPWDLTHIARNIKVHRTKSKEFNDEYIIFDANEKKRTYIKVKGLDFHLLSKDSYMSLVDE